MFRLWQFDLSIDFLGRFLNDDLDCNGKYCSGSIEKSDWLMRVMVGWEFYPVSILSGTNRHARKGAAVCVSSEPQTGAPCSFCAIWIVIAIRL